MTLENSLLYQAILEGFNHGVLIVTQHNRLVYANSLARQICQGLAPNSAQVRSLPDLVWYACQCLVRAQADYQGKRVIVDYNVAPAQKVTIRITARWLEAKADATAAPEEASILVILESSMPVDSAIIWAAPPEYGFTPREAEVWSLARAGHTYRQIAQQLFISLNTVKKHMKNALAKEQSRSLNSPI